MHKQKTENEIIWWDLVMFNKKFVLAISLFSIFLIGAARADIASTTYVKGDYDTAGTDADKQKVAITVSGGTVSAMAAKRDQVGVSKLGVIPSGSTGDGTATIWIQ